MTLNATAGNVDLFAVDPNTLAPLDAIDQIVDTWFVTYLPGTVDQWTDAYTGAFWIIQ